MTLAFRVVSGSRLSGLAVEGSDTDYLEVHVGTQSQYLGVAQLTESKQVQLGGSDVRMYDLRKFANLLMAGNYQCLSALYAPVEFVEFCHPAFFRLIENRAAFLSRNSVASALGQARGEVARMQGVYDAKGAARALFLVGEAQDMMLHGSVLTWAGPVAKAVRSGQLGEATFKRLYKEGMDRANEFSGNPRGKPNFVGDREPDREFVSGLVSSVVFGTWAAGGTA